MAGAAASLWIKLGLSDSEFDKGLKQAENKLNRFGSRLSTLGSRITTGISLPFAVAGAAAVKMAADMETAEVAFTTLLGSAAKAQKQLTLLKDFAAKTPFQFTELTESTRMMLAFGFSAEQVIPTLKILGDTTSALGIGNEGLQRIIMSLGQMKARGSITGEEIREMAHSGIPVLELLGKALKKNTSDIMPMIEKKMISSSVAIKAILEGLANDPKFAGGMEKQMNTINGLWSNFLDTLKFGLADLGKEIASGTNLKEILQGFTDAIKDFTNWFSKLSPVVKSAIVDIALFTAVLGPLVQIISYVVKGFSGLIGVLRLFGPIVSVIPTFISNLVAAYGTMATGSAAAASATVFLTKSASSFVPIIGIIVAAIGAAVIGYNLWNSAQQEAEKRAQKTAATNNNTAKSFINLYNARQQSGTNVDKNSKSEKDFQDRMNQIAKIFPGVVTQYDNLGNARKIDIGLLQQQIDKENELERLRSKNSKDTAVKKAQDNLKDAKENLKFYQEQLDSLQKQGKQKYAEETAPALQIGASRTGNNITTAQAIEQAKETYDKGLESYAEGIRNGTKKVESAQEKLDIALGKKKKVVNKPTVTKVPGLTGGDNNGGTPIKDTTAERTKLEEKARIALEDERQQELDNLKMNYEEKLTEALQYYDKSDAQQKAYGELATNYTTKYNQDIAAINKKYDDDAYKKMLDQQDRMIAAYNQAVDEAREENDPWGYAIEQSTKDWDDWGKHIQEISSAAVSGVQSSVSSLLGDALHGDLNSFSDYFDQFLDSIISAWSNAMAQMAANNIVNTSGFDWLKNLFGGGSSTSTTSYSSGADLGHRETGGSTSAGKTYVVGENGPELFTSNRSGKIISNSDLTGESATAGRTSTAPNVQINNTNKSGTDTTTKQTGSSFDGKTYIITTIQEAAANNTGGMRDLFKSFGSARG